MNLSYLIARRYLFSKHKRTFISVISFIAMAAVAVGTTALIVVLSVFNGLEALHRQLFSTIDADLKVAVRQGKNFEVSEKLLGDLKRIPGVQSITEVIEDFAVIRYKDAQMAVILKGVSDDFLQRKKMADALDQGELVLHRGEAPFAIMGQGVQHILSVSLKDEFSPMQAWYPRNRKTINLTSENAFNRLNIAPGAVFRLEQQYDDNYVFVPLSFARELLEYGNKRTALEMLVKPGTDVAQVQEAVKARMGEAYDVLDQDEQHASLLRAILWEKFFVYITLSFILAVASFNIFFALTMLAIDKQRDVGILYAMGATPQLVRNIFLKEGALVAFSGALLGMLFGVGLCYAQDKFGIVPMGMTTSIVEAYPVKMKASDFLFTGLTIILITFLSSFFPAIKAARQVNARVAAS